MARFGRRGMEIDLKLEISRRCQVQRSRPRSAGRFFDINIGIVTECKGASQDLVRAGWPMAWAPKCLVISACMCQALSRDIATPRSSSISVQPWMALDWASSSNWREREGLIKNRWAGCEMLQTLGLLLRIGPEHQPSRGRWGSGFPSHGASQCSIASRQAPLSSICTP